MSNTHTSLTTPLATLMNSVSSWAARTGPAPFTKEERMEMARRIAAAKVWRTPQDQDDSVDEELEEAKAKGQEHMQRLREQAMALSWEDLGFEGLTDDLIEDMLEHIRETCASTSAAAIQVGLDPGLLRRWLQEGKTHACPDTQCSPGIAATNQEADGHRAQPENTGAPPGVIPWR